MLDVTRTIYNAIVNNSKQNKQPKDQTVSERTLVLNGIINQSLEIVNKLGDCSQKPSLKKGDIQRKNFDLLFYNEDGTPKSKKELEEVKKQYMRNAEWCESEKEKEIG